MEESDDNGFNWFPVFTFPTILGNGIYRSPKLPLTGNRVRYNQTVGGTTPSFTRIINRVQSNDIVSTFGVQKPYINAVIVAGGTSQLAINTNPVRKAFEIQNNSSADMWFNTVANAGINIGIKLGAGQAYTTPSNAVDTGVIQIWGATTGQQYVIKEY